MNRQFPLFFHPDPPAGTIVPPADSTTAPPAATQPPEPEKRPIVCGWCSCKLDRKGNVLERGAKVVEFLDWEETEREHKRQHATKDQKIADLERQCADLRAQLAPYKNRKFGEFV